MMRYQRDVDVMGSAQVLGPAQGQLLPYYVNQPLQGILNGAQADRNASSFTEHKTSSCARKPQQRTAARVVIVQPSHG
jgi:hypothetical protein